jgi:hypothetical protein
MFTAPLIAIVGLVCATTLAVGFGFVVPVSSAVRRPRVARDALRSIRSKRSATAGADYPQPAFERAQIPPSAAGCSSGAVAARENCASRSGTPVLGFPCRSSRRSSKNTGNRPIAEHGLGLGLSIVKAYVGARAAPKTHRGSYGAFNRQWPPIVGPPEPLLRARLPLSGRT